MNLAFLEEWLDMMTMAENMIRVRQNGVAYINPDKVFMASRITQMVGVDLDTWIDDYYDMEKYS